jgi:biotin transport system substrate-specific component
MAHTLALLAGALATAALARLRLRLPRSAVPVTGQSLGALLAGGLLGPRDGCMAMLLYLLGGTLGLPVFAGGARGPGVLRGPGGGYLITFPLAAWLVGQTSWPARGFGDRFGAMLLGHTLILTGGAAWLALRPDPAQPTRRLGVTRVLQTGIWPLVPGALLKSLLAALLCQLLSGHRRTRQ